MVAALTKQGKKENALKHYTEALELNDNTLEIYLAMGNAMLGAGEIKNAILHFQNALQINNQSAEAHTNLGYALYKQGIEDEAIKHCLEAVRLDPDKSIAAYYNLACICSKRNELTESVNWLKKAIDKGFNNWDLLRTDKDLKHIRSTAYYIDITNKHQ
jgi:tetratricopeptide (TPR) repeat protein